MERFQETLREESRRWQESRGWTPSQIRAGEEFHRRLGGGGRGYSARQEPSGIAARQEAERLAKEQTARDIETERRQALADAEARYKQAMSRQQLMQFSREERMRIQRERTAQFEQERAKIQAIADVKRVGAGVEASAMIGGTLVTPQTAAQFEESLTQEKYRKEVAKAIQRGEKVEFTPEGVRIFTPEKKWRDMTSEERMAKYEEFQAKPFKEKYPYLVSKKKGGKGFNIVGSTSDVVWLTSQKIYEKAEPYIPEKAKIPVKVPSSLYYLPGYVALFELFSPAMSTGVAKKGKAKAKIVEKSSKKVRLTDKEIKELMKAYENVARAKWKYGTSAERESIRNLFRKALETGDSAKIEQMQRFLESSLGKKEAAALIKDVLAQETAVTTGAGVEILAPKTATIPTGEITSSIYAGTGLYEKGKPGDFPFVRSPTDVLTFEEEVTRKAFPGFVSPSTTFGTPEGQRFEGITPETRYKLGEKEIVSPRVPSALRENVLNKVGAASILGMKGLEGLRGRTRLRTGQALGSALMTLQAQQPLQKLQQLQRQRLRLKQQSILRQTQIPKLRGGFTFPFLSSSESKQKVLKSAIKKLAKFKVWERRYGKWRGIGAFPTLKQASLFGQRRTALTLGASFMITKGGKPLNINVGNMFRKSKREPGVFVEKRRFRLSEPSEVKEILQARSKSSKGKKLSPKKINWIR